MAVSASLPGQLLASCVVCAMGPAARRGERVHGYSSRWELRLWTPPFAGMGKPWVERSCHALGQTWTRNPCSFLLPSARLSAWLELKLQASNPSMAFKAHTPSRTCPRDLHFTEEESEALRDLGPCPGMLGPSLRRLGWTLGLCSEPFLLPPECQRCSGVWGGVAGVLAQADPLGEQQRRM